MIVGTLRGFDQFMNLVIDNTVEVNGNEKNEIGMVVSPHILHYQLNISS
jgi:small nuclear ribonucleoprotein G